VVISFLPRTTRPSTGQEKVEAAYEIAFPVTLVDQICDLMEKLKLLWSAKIQQGVEVLSGFVLVALFVEPEQDGRRVCRALGKAHDDVQARLLLVPFYRTQKFADTSPRPLASSMENLLRYEGSVDDPQKVRDGFPLP